MSKQELIKNLQEKFPEFHLFNLFEILDRRDFLPGANAIDADLDKPISIGEFQHSLEPSAIIEILNELNLSENDTVLEIGTGSGYLTACVFKQITPGNLVTIERIKNLCALAKQNLKNKFPEAIENKNIRIVWENGLQSPNKFPENSFDKIYLTFDAEKSFDLDGFIKILKPEGIIVFYQNKMLKSYTKSARNKPFLIQEKEVPYKFDKPKRGKS